MKGVFLQEKNKIVFSYVLFGAREQHDERSRTACGKMMSSPDSLYRSSYCIFKLSVTPLPRGGNCMGTALTVKTGIKSGQKWSAGQGGIPTISTIGQAVKDNFRNLILQSRAFLQM